MKLDVRIRKAPSLTTLLTGPVGLRIRRNRREITRVAARHGASNVRIFGSVARGEEKEGSDVDLLVDLAPDIGLLAWLASNTTSAPFSTLAWTLSLRAT